MKTERSAALARAWRRRLGDRSDPLKALLVVVIAGFSFLITTLAALQIDAGAHAAIAARTADSIGAAAAGRDSAAVIQTSTDLGVVRRWSETLFDAGWAQDVIDRGAAGTPQSPGDRPGDVPDAALARELLRIDRELLEWAQEQSPLFAPPYFDDAGVDTDIARLDAERNVGPRVRAAEERRLAIAEAGNWSRRAGDYLTAITIVAAGLFFLGVAVASKGIARRILAVAGLAAGLVAIGLAVVVVLQPVDRVPAGAVDAVVEARMASSRTDWTDVSVVDERDRRDYGAAIAAAEQAVAAAPEYPSAYLARAEVKARFGDDLLLAVEPSPDEAKPLLAAALADYERYVGMEPGSYEAWWNYGWVAYLVGDNPTAIAAADRALELSPDQFTLYLNRALARVSSGDLPGSRADVATALDVAGRSRLDSNAWFFAQADYDLGRLAALRPAEAAELLGIQRQVRAAAIAQRIGRPAGPADARVLASPGLRALTLGDDARLREGRTIQPGAELPAASLVGVRLSIAAGTVPNGAVVSVRLRENGREQAAYRVDRPWPADATELVLDLVSPSGRIGIPMDPNDYTIEVFLDAVTQFEIAFAVGEPGGAFGATGSAVVALMTDGGLTCAEPQPGSGAASVTCLTTGTTREIGTETITTFDDRDRLMSLSVSRAVPAPAIEAELRQFAAAAIGFAVEDAIAPGVREWIATAAPGASTTIGGIALSLAADSGAPPRLSFEARIAA